MVLFLPLVVSPHAEFMGLIVHMVTCLVMLGLFILKDLSQKSRDKAICDWLRALTPHVNSEVRRNVNNVIKIIEGKSKDD